jgi:N4-gp56 family major capsid protein
MGIVPTMQSMTAVGNQLTLEIRTFYEMQLLPRLLPFLPHADKGMKKSIPRQGGTVLDARRFESLTTAAAPTALTESVNPNPLPTTQTHVQATPLQYGDYLMHSDRVDLQAMDNCIMEFMNLIKEHAGRLFDNVIRNVLITATNAFWGGNKTQDNQIDDTSRFTVILAKRAARFLNGNNCPKYENGAYICLIHPDIAFDIQNDKDWITAHKYGKPQAFFANEVGMVAGIRFIESTQCWRAVGTGSSTAANITGSKVTAAAADVYYSILLAPDAYMCVDYAGVGGSSPEILVTSAGVVTVADPLALTGTMGFKGWQTAAIVDNNRMCLIITSATL